MYIDIYIYRERAHNYCRQNSLCICLNYHPHQETGKNQPVTLCHISISFLKSIRSSMNLQAPMAGPSVLIPTPPTPSLALVHWLFRSQ